MCMEDNADVKCNFHFDKNKKEKKKKETQVPLFVSGGNCSIYLKQRMNLNDFPYHIGINMRLFFVKSNVSISFLLAFMKTPGFGFKRKKRKKQTNKRDNVPN